MDPDDIRKIRKNLIHLKERLGKQLHDLDRIIDILVENEIFQFNKKEEILAGKTDSEKMDNFLRCLWASGANAYGLFRDALLSFPDLRYEDVVSALDNTDLNTRREDTFSRRPYTQRGSDPYEDATKDPYACLASKMDQFSSKFDKLDKLDQLLDSQAKMNSSIESIKQSQKEDRINFDRELRKERKEKTELAAEYDRKLKTLRKQYESLNDKLLEKDKRVNQLLQDNESLKKNLKQKDACRIYTQNNETIKRLQNEIKCLKEKKEKLERENTVLKKDSSSFLKPHPKASAALPKASAALPQIQMQPTSNRSNQDLYLKKK